MVTDAAEMESIFLEDFEKRVIDLEKGINSLSDTLEQAKQVRY